LRGNAARVEYNSVMLLNRKAIIEKYPSLNRPDPTSRLSAKEEQGLIDFVIERARERQAHFLFVHPLSTSGYISPRQFLKLKTDRYLTPSEFEITYSHNVS